MVMRSPTVRRDRALVPSKPQHSVGPQGAATGHDRPMMPCTPRGSCAYWASNVSLAGDWPGLSRSAIKNPWMPEQEDVKGGSGVSFLYVDVNF